MATVTCGFGTSHSPLLSIPAGLWSEWTKFRDYPNRALLDNQGILRSYPELAAAVQDRFLGEIQPEVILERYSRCQRAIGRLASEIDRSGIDALIILGDDQVGEVFEPSNIPAIYIYCGEEVLNRHVDPFPDLPDAVNFGRWGSAGSRDRHYPVAQELAVHLVSQLVEGGFDIAQGKELPREKSIGHAFGFVINRLIPHLTLPIVPIMINSYFPPNQPTPARCYSLGQALHRAVESFPPSWKVGIMASGGWSHFVVDEEIDGITLLALSEGRTRDLINLPIERLNSGTSEIRNWIVAGSAFEDLELKWIDYIPCYRSEAGPGLGAAFAVWR